MRERTWFDVLEHLQGRPIGVELTLELDQVGHPREHIVPGSPTFRSALGLPRKGSIAQWRLALPDGGALHVVEYPTHYTAHLDQVDPLRDPLGHLKHDAPGAGVVLGAAAGGAAGLFFGVLFAPVVAAMVVVPAAVAGGALAARAIRGNVSTEAGPDGTTAAGRTGPDLTPQHGETA